MAMKNGYHFSICLSDKVQMKRLLWKIINGIKDTIIAVEDKTAEELYDLNNIFNIIREICDGYNLLSCSFNFGQRNNVVFKQQDNGDVEIDILINNSEEAEIFKNILNLIIG